MPGGSSQTTNQSQNSASTPWTAAQPLLQNLLSSYGGLSTSVTPAQAAAGSQLTSDTSAIPNFGAPASGTLNNAFNFSTAPQMGLLSNSLNNLTTSTAPLTNPASLNPMNTPGFSTALNTMNQDITNQVGNEYAASGREPSGAGAQPQTLARGLSQGEGGLIASQYNANAGNLLNASNSAFNAGNTAAGSEANLGLLPISTGLTAAAAAPGVASDYAAPGSTALSAANTAYQTPWTNLAQLLTPSATLGSLGGQTTGSGTSTTTGSSSPISNIIGGASSGIGLLSLLMSDKRVKENIEPVGKLKDGQTIHRFNFKGSPVTHIGLLAQEVQKKTPDAVAPINKMGILGVDYRRATDRAAAMKEAA